MAARLTADQRKDIALQARPNGGPEGGRQSDEQGEHASREPYQPSAEIATAARGSGFLVGTPVGRCSLSIPKTPSAARSLPLRGAVVVETPAARERDDRVTPRPRELAVGWALRDQDFTRRLPGPPILRTPGSRRGGSASHQPTSPALPGSPFFRFCGFEYYLCDSHWCPHYRQ